MRFVVAAGYGGPEQLVVREGELPAPGPGRVQVEVRAAGVNPFDAKVYSGAMGADEARLPLRLGVEAAGVVTAVGDGAAGPAGPVGVGDEVIVHPVSGGYASALDVPATSVVPKPATLSWEQAAGLSLIGVTAYHLLEATGVGAGDTVLVHGVAGGVGLSTAQLAIARGAAVVGTAAEHRHEALRGHGVVPVVYGDGLADRVRAAAPAGIDAALDTVGTDEAVDVSLALAPLDRIASVAAFDRGDTGIKLLGAGPGGDPGTDIRRRARLEVAALAGRGELEVVVAGTFPLDRVADAHRLVLGGHAGGKVVLLP
ncbi:NADP-dependent oxidoreductase [uncultured Nocardioides sp.]|uniref:quinone oxidoreductase family protein n=1 Tax=uncultured Nocardioides sp. TaxID=198441 RepID=UPI0025F9C76D|nr:NADP-dependent oxidoreductase [uncultured Nocardioides sp.]